LWRFAERSPAYFLDDVAEESFVRGVKADKEFIEWGFSSVDMHLSSPDVQ
jgi:hypothetical protein